MDKLGKNVNEILDELLFGNFEDLEGMEQSVFYRGNITKPRKALSDIDNLLKKISSKTPEKLTQEAENSVNNIASPTPPRSPQSKDSTINIFN